MVTPHTVAHLVPYYREIEGGASSALDALGAAWTSLTSSDWTYRPLLNRGQPVQHNRNVLVHWALDLGPCKFLTGVPRIDRPADYVVFQDSDVSFKPADVVELIGLLHESPEDVAAVGAPCIIQSRSGEPEVNVNFNGFEESKPGCMAGQTLPVAQVGFGLIVIRATALRAQGFPWFGFGYGATIDEVIGEDGGWCDNIRALGWTVLCAGAVMPAHTFPREFSLRTSRDWFRLSGAKEAT